MPEEPVDALVPSVTTLVTVFGLVVVVVEELLVKALEPTLVPAVGLVPTLVILVLTVVVVGGGAT